MMKLLKTLLIALFFSLISLSAQAQTSTVIVAGGCFWCVEKDFEKVPGVIDVVSGYSGGHVANPSYEQVASKKTGHFEVVKITFDDSKLSLKTLVDYFWKTIDPTDPKGQFCDKGSPYKTALFYNNEAQQKVMEQSLSEAKASKPFSAPIVTPILPAKTFYPAEDYHQNYARVNPVRYNYYRYGCGRDATIKRLWGEVASKKYH